MVGIDTQQLYRIDSDCSLDGHMHLHHGSSSSVGSIETTFEGPELRSNSPIDIPDRSIVVISVKKLPEWTYRVGCIRSLLECIVN